jgi:HlyD family secretion protein
MNQVTDVESLLREAKRVYELDKVLYDKKAIGSQEFQQAKNNYDYYTQKMKLTDQIMKQDSVSTAVQLTQNKQLLIGAQKAMNVLEKKASDLIVRAPVDGQLTSLDAEIGQNKNKGERLGQIDVLSGFKVRVDVDEHYISRIYSGLRGKFTFADSNYDLKIFKVYTQVTAGHFQVDMSFVGPVPKGIRRGQTLQILLALSEEKQAILVPRGGFYQQTGGNWIFKVSEDGKMAYRADIQLGNQNPEYYEVLQGLNPGDKVVTSSYENYGTMQELILKK